MAVATDIIKRPLITEKATWEGQKHNRYAFLVDRRATKPQIAAAIKELYNVRVQKVATQVRKSEITITRFGESRGAGWKKALVKLHPDDKIDLL